MPEAGRKWPDKSGGEKRMTSPSILMKAWNLHPKKQLGQNFLADPNTARAIVDKTGVAAEDVVLEIGAGLGALTRPIAEKARQVIAVERDHRLVSLLKTELTAAGRGNVTVVEKDILKLDIPSLAASVKKDLIVMGNVPYNISSQILVRVIKARGCVKKAALMFQRELADRIMAGPGSKTYGRLSVMVQYCAMVEVLMEVRAALFYPRPTIDSLVLGFEFKSDLALTANDESFFFNVIKAAFSKRRKTLRNSLAGFIPGFDHQAAAAALETVGIDPVRRAETLTVDEFVRLGNFIYAEYR